MQQSGSSSVGSDEERAREPAAEAADHVSERTPDASSDGTELPDEPTAAAGSTAVRGSKWRAVDVLRRVWVAIVLVIVGSGYLGYATYSHSDALSPIDEWVYVDYLLKVPDQGIVRQGEDVGTAAREIISCDGLQAYGRQGAECGADYADDSGYPYQGKTTADAYTPIYFQVTYWTTKAIQAVSGEDFIDAARLTSVIWLDIGLVLLVVLMRRFKIPDLMVLAAGLVIIGSPYAWWTYSYIGTDAPTLALACVVTYCALGVMQGRSRGWWFIGWSVLATLVKVTNIFAVGLGVLLILLGWFFRWRVERRAGRSTPPLAPVWIALGAAGLAIGLEAAWLVIRGAIAVGPIPDQEGLSALGIAELISQSTNFIEGALSSNVVLSGTSALTYAYPIPTGYVRPLAWIGALAVIGSLLAARASWQRQALRWSTALAAVAFPPVLAVVMTLSQGYYFVLPSRYGAALIPIYFVLLGLLMRNRILQVILGVYGTGLIFWGIGFASFYWGSQFGYHP